MYSLFVGPNSLSSPSVGTGPGHQANLYLAQMAFGHLQCGGEALEHPANLPYVYTVFGPNGLWSPSVQGGFWDIQILSEPQNGHPAVTARCSDHKWTFTESGVTLGIKILSVCQRKHIMENAELTLNFVLLCTVVLLGLCHLLVEAFGQCSQSREGLTEVPSDIPSDCWYVSLRRNSITALPSGAFSSLSQCEELYLDINQISDIDAGAFTGLSVLEKLILKENAITNLPAGVFSPLTQCQFIDLTENEISAIDGSVFTGLGNLVRLHLSNNKITSLPAGVFSALSGCVVIEIYRNKISEIEEGAFTGLVKLKHLIMHMNSLTSIPPRIFSPLTKCIEISLEHNQITHIADDTFAGLNNLIWLWLNINQILEIGDAAFNGLTELLKLDLSSNQITHISAGLFQPLEKCIKLNLIYNPLTLIEDNAFTGLSSLELLMLHHTDLETLSPGVLNGVHTPVTLALSSPFTTDDTLWQCNTLCWLKEEEKAGNIKWMKISGKKYKPECQDLTSWKNLQCPGGSKFLNQIYTCRA